MKKKKRIVFNCSMIGVSSQTMKIVAWVTEKGVLNCSADFL